MSSKFLIKNIISMLILGIFIVTSAFASHDYYADVTLTVDETGSLNIEGVSNHPLLKEGSYQNYTTKEGSVWTLNFTINDSLSDYIYELRFPSNAIISYLKVPNNLGITEDSGYLTVIGTGNNQNLIILAQYSFRSKKSQFFRYAIFIILTMVAITGSYFVITLFKKGYFKRRTAPNTNHLSRRQTDIYTIIFNHKEGITQAKLQQLTGLPKASLSRNIDTLQRKKLISKEQKGMTNYLTIIEQK